MSKDKVIGPGMVYDTETRPCSGMTYVQLARILLTTKPRTRRERHGYASFPCPPNYAAMDEHTAETEHNAENEHTAETEQE